MTNLNLRVDSALPARYSITTSSGAGGTIEPGGPVEVVSGSSVTFTITASPGFHLQNLLVDGMTQGVPATYTFTNVTGNHTISASFTANSGGGVSTFPLSVTSVPTGAAIFIDGVGSGQTNATVQNVTAGTHNVTLTKAGYLTETKQVSVQSGGANSVSFTLQPTSSVNTFPLSVTSVPTGAAIFIDGVGSGQTNATVQNVTAGMHNVTLTKAGYLTETKQVIVQGGGANSVSFTLQPTKSAGIRTRSFFPSSIRDIRRR